MATNEIFPPFPIFPDIDSEPLEAGYIYIGEDGLDPETNPIATFWDEALTIPADQPLRTLNGYLQQNGAPGRVYADADSFSITIRNKNGALVNTSLSTNRAIPFSDITGDSSISTRVESLAALVGGAFSEDIVEVSSYYAGWAATVNGPKGRAKWYKTGATAAAPTAGTPVTGFETAGRIGAGDGTGLYTGQSAQAGYGWDTTGAEWRISPDENGFVDVEALGAYANGGANDDYQAFQDSLDTGFHVKALQKTSYYLGDTPILRQSGQEFIVKGQLVLTGASGTAALQIGESAAGFNVDFAKVWIQRVDGQNNTAGRDAIRYDYAVTCEVHVQRIINCRYGHHMRMFSATGRFIHNDVTGNIISRCQIGVYQQNAVMGVTELDNEGNDFRINIITGSIIGAFIVEDEVRGNGSLVMINFDAQENYYINDSAFGQPNILICTDWPEDQTANNGSSDGSTAAITGLSDTSVFTEGCYVRVSAGFPSTIEAYQVVSVDSGTQITIDTNSTSVVAGTIQVRRTNFFADRDVVIGDGLFKQGRRPFRPTYCDLDVSDAPNNDMRLRFFNDGILLGAIGYNFSDDMSLETTAGQQIRLDNFGGVELRNRIFLNGQQDNTLSAGNNNDEIANSNTSVWRLTTDAGGSTLTGIAGGGLGRILNGVNLGPGDLTLANENASSGSGNRIITGTGADVVLTPDQTFSLWYDNTTQRWRFWKT